MKTVTINGYNVSTYNLGVVGEHNATKLVITPPHELQGDNVAYWRVLFKLRNKADPLITLDYHTYPMEVMLVQALTINSSLSLQVVAYDSNGDYLGISKKIDGFYFEPSDYNAMADRIKEYLDDPIIGLTELINSKASIEYVDAIAEQLEEEIENMAEALTDDEIIRVCSTIVDFITINENGDYLGIDNQTAIAF